MAYVKIGQIKSTPAKALAYIARPDATAEGVWVSTNAAVINPSDFKAVARQFSDTVERVWITTPRAGSVLAHHLIQSFDPKEGVGAEDAHRIGLQLAERVTGGQHEYMVATHFDKGHVHNHIILNAVNFESGRKFRAVKDTLAEIRAVSDELCAAHGLSVLPPASRSTGRSMHDVYRVLKGESGKEVLRTEIDKAVARSTSWAEFETVLGRAGIEVMARGGRTGTLSFREITMGRAVRDHRLGMAYTESSLMARMAKSAVNMVGIDASMIVRETRDTLTVTVPGTQRELSMTVSKRQIIRRGRALRVYLPAASKQLLADREGNLAKTIGTPELYQYFARPALSQLVGTRRTEAEAWNVGLSRLRQLLDEVNAKARWITPGTDAAEAVTAAQRSLQTQHFAYQTTLVAAAELMADPARADDPQLATLKADLRVMEREISATRTDLIALERLITEVEMDERSAGSTSRKDAATRPQPTGADRKHDDTNSRHKRAGKEQREAGALAARIAAEAEKLRHKADRSRPNGRDGRWDGRNR